MLFRSARIRATCTIGQTAIQLKLAPVGRHRTEIRAGRQQPARDLPAATPLRIELTYALRASATTAWQDEPGRPLEQQLAGIAADLIVARDASFRQSLVEAREHAERMRRWQAEAEPIRLEELNHERLACFESSGMLLRQADHLRALVERVARAVVAGGLELGAGELDAWRQWALARADELDPLLSGQALGHIRPAS